MRSPCLIWAECGRPSETGSVSHGRGSKTENRGGALGLMAGGHEASAGERRRGKAGNRLHSELGGRGLYFDRQQEEGLTPGNALWQRAVGRSASTVAGRRGDHWRWRRGRRGRRGGVEAHRRGSGVGGRPGRPIHDEASRRTRKNSGSPLCSGWRSSEWLAEERLRAAALAAAGTLCSDPLAAAGAARRRAAAGAEGAPERDADGDGAARREKISCLSAGWIRARQVGRRGTVPVVGFGLSALARRRIWPGGLWSCTGCGCLFEFFIIFY
jgi:hypothetical protein